MMRVVLLGLVVMGCSPCRPADDYYDFRVGYGTESYAYARAPEWGGRTPSASFGELARWFWVGFPEGRVSSAPMISVLRDGVALDLPFREVTGLVHRDGPPNRDAQLYDLGALPAGEYTIIHRRASAPADLVAVFPASDPWQVVDGEEILETRITLGTVSSDAGVGDAR